MLNIKSGVQSSTYRFVVYGVEAVGKTTFASKFPKPLFLDTEGSTKTYDLDRVVCENWSTLNDTISELTKSKNANFDTIIIDTADWAEAHLKTDICRIARKKSIEDFGFGKGYVTVGEEWNSFLQRLTKLTEAGYHVVVLAHSQLTKFDAPDETGSYDRYELKLTKAKSMNNSQLTKEWADAVFFAKIETICEKNDSGKLKARSKGNRVMFTQHHAAWDAKNRFGLDEELDFDFKAISHLFKPATISAAKQEGTQDKPAVLPPREKKEVKSEPIIESANEVIEGKFIELDPLQDCFESFGITDQEFRHYLDTTKTKYIPLGTPYNLIGENIKNQMIQNMDKILKSIKGA